MDLANRGEAQQSAGGEGDKNGDGVFVKLELMLVDIWDRLWVSDLWSGSLFRDRSNGELRSLFLRAEFEPL